MKFILWLVSLLHRNIYWTEHKMLVRPKRIKYTQKEKNALNKRQNKQAMNGTMVF